jgi:hypothetical protein
MGRWAAAVVVVVVEGGVIVIRGEMITVAVSTVEWIVR